MTMPVGTTQFTDVQVTGAFYDANGAAIPLPSGEADTITVYNGTGGTLAQDTLVYLSGIDAASGYPKIVKADADAGSRPAQYFLPAGILDSASGQAQSYGLSAATLDTNAATVGDPVYESATAGGWTLSALTTYNAEQRRVGTVKVKSASIGQILWEISQLNKVGANEYQDDSVRAAALGVTAGAITASRALVADSNGNVAALKTTSLSVGVSGSEVAITASPADINATIDQPIDAEFTIGAESAHARVITVQLEDADDANIAVATCVHAYWSSDAAGSVPVTGPAQGQAYSTAGVSLHDQPTYAGPTLATVLVWTLKTGAAGMFNINATNNAAVTVYLNVILPNGIIKTSAAIVFAG